MMQQHQETDLPFHPLINQWFHQQMGLPTPMQHNGWSQIAAGQHVLITAPTGSGKTLTAFLWALNQLIQQVWSGGCTRVLYISPLKALNNDIRRNLITPLNELKNLFEKENIFFPSISVKTRSGDTTSNERRRMLRHPPEILITTPESLNLLHSSKGGRTLLGGITTVILDEIHAVVGNKRGVHLISAVDRLVRLSGEFQRICLSATVHPPDVVAQFAGGYQLSGTATAAQYTPRPVTVIHSDTPTKQYQVKVSLPKQCTDRPVEESVWKPLVQEFKNIINRNRSTLLFTNSRRLCEKLTLNINQGEPQASVYAHHGSLSREIREIVESRLKNGALKAIVATNSLELGIDIGDLDEVVLIQSPPSVSAAIQRVGRAGHRLNEISRGTFFPTHPQDFLEAAVLASAIPMGDIEKISPVQCPLDVLAQIVVSMVGVETWDKDDLYAWLKTSYPYRNLSRNHFDLVLNMLAGRYAQSRIRELKPRISIDGIDNTIAAKPGALLTLYTSGGVIPDRGYYHLRHMETNARIGELDEEFVWEATIGQIFTLGTQNWKIAKITHNDVFVTPAPPNAMAAPFWRAEMRYRDYHFSRKIAQFLESANLQLDHPDFIETLKSEHFMNAFAAKELVQFLKHQKNHTQCDLPHRHHLVIEYIDAGPGSVPGYQVVLHTLWGGPLNYPFALALCAAWEEKYGHKIEVYPDNDCISLMLSHEESPEALLSLVTDSQLLPLLQKRLENSGFFSARFRECAGRALLLTRRKINERVPLWMSRLRSQKLFESVSEFKDFPILLETWRTCLQDEFDLEHLHQRLTEIATGHITWSAVHTCRPSPMAQSMAWRQINKYMYMEDGPSPDKNAHISNDLLKDLIFTTHLRPTLEKKIISTFELKRQRLAAGYSPATSRDLLDWTKERLLIPLGEWHKLMEAIQRDHGLDHDTILAPISEKLLHITPEKSVQGMVCALETAQEIIDDFYGHTASIKRRSVHPDTQAKCPAIPVITKEPAAQPSDPEQFLGLRLNQWLQFYGPVSENFIQKTLGLASGRLQSALQQLIDTRKIITGPLVTGGSNKDFCDAENFEILLRLTRKEAVPAMDPLSLEDLQLFLAAYQGVARPSNDNDALYTIFDQLLCCPLKAKMWEAEVLPARLSQYRKEMTDRILQETDLLWIGNQKENVLFSFETDLDLLNEEKHIVQTKHPRDTSHPQNDPEKIPAHQTYQELFSDPDGRYHFATIMRQTGRTAVQLSNLLWQGVWSGHVSTDSLSALRQGITNGFKPPKQAHHYLSQQHRNKRPIRTGHRISGRSAFHHWKKDHHPPGNWFLIPTQESTDDPLDKEERNKARIRILLDRYGLIFRELLLREAPAMRWSALFRSMRIMELSGEVLAGCFFHGIPGLQFISARALRFLQARLPQKPIYWINAADPASICGLHLDALKGKRPARRPSTHIVYHGTKQVMVSRGHGKKLTFEVPPDAPEMSHYLGPLHHLLTRPFDPLPRLTVDTINAKPAAASPYLDALRVSFEVVPDYQKITLYHQR